MISFTEDYCPELTEPVNSKIVCDNTTEGGTCYIICDENFILPYNASGVYHCVEAGVWSPADLPTQCIGESSVGSCRTQSCWHEGYHRYIDMPNTCLLTETVYKSFSIFCKSCSLSLNKHTPHLINRFLIAVDASPPWTTCQKTVHVFFL